MPSGFFPRILSHPWNPHADTSDQTGDNQSLITTYTAFYNSTLCSESSARKQEALFEELERTNQSFVHARLLLGLWLRQRGFDESLSGGGFGDHDAALLLASLLQSDDVKTRKVRVTLRQSQEPVQLFRGFVHFLATHDLFQDPISVGNGPKEAGSDSRDYRVMFFDGNLGFNLLYKMSVSSYEQVGSGLFQASSVP